MLKQIYAVSCICLLFVVLGCSDKQPLSGTVTFSDDGSPVTRGSVLFTSPTLLAVGVIKPDGTYVVGTEKQNDGIPKGEYKVTISGADDIAITPGAMGSRNESRTPLIDKKYTSSETTDLSFTVDGKTKKFDIQLDRYKGR